MNNCANATSNTLFTANSAHTQLHGDQNRGPGDGWPLAVHRGDHDSNRVPKAINNGGYCCAVPPYTALIVPSATAKERKSFAEIVRSGHEDVGDTNPVVAPAAAVGSPAPFSIATAFAAAAAANTTRNNDTTTTTSVAASANNDNHSDSILCDFNTIENPSVRSVLENVFDENVRVGESSCSQLEDRIGDAKALGSIVCRATADVRSTSCENCATDFYGLLGNCAIDASASNWANNIGGASDECPYSPTPPNISTPFFDGASPTLFDSFGKTTAAATAPNAALFNLICGGSPSPPSDLTPFAAGAAGHASTAAPAPTLYHPSAAAVFVCLRCGEATNLSAYSVQEVGSLGDGRRPRHRRYRNRGGAGHAVAHHSRRYNAFETRAGVGVLGGGGKRRSGYRRVNS